MTVNNENTFNKGATLVEVVIMIALMAITASLISTNFFNLQNQITIDNAANDLVGNLREAQQNAISQKEGSAWGIYADSPVGSSSYYKIFYGASYAAGTVSKRVTLSTKLKFTDPAAGATKELLFSKSTGLLSAGAPATLVISLLSDLTVYRTVTINALGLISL